MDLLAEHHHHHDEHTHHHGRHLPEIERLITAAELPSRAEAWSLAVFRQSEAEGSGAWHPDQVHFHEVGAVDAIVDIGTSLGLDWLGIEQLTARRYRLEAAQLERHTASYRYPYQRC